MIELLEGSLADQRELARLVPEDESRYRERFASIETLLARLHVVEHSRGAIVRRYEQIALSAFAAVAVAAAVAFVWRQSRQAARLERLGRALEGLAAGRTDLDLGERRRDTLGRIAG